MEKEVMEVLNDSILEGAAQRYGVTRESLKFINDFENYIYEFEKDNRFYILRLTHSSHRTEGLVNAELDWINYLHENGASVCPGIPSINNRLVERVEAQNSYFLATVFEKAPGEHVERSNNHIWNEKLFENWGQVVGKMHASTKKYNPPENLTRRIEWYEDDLVANASKYLSIYGDKVLKKQEALVEWCNSLPKDNDSYGLIHTDVHEMNFFVDNRNITIFDFDDCQYNWFINDIAIVLFYVIWWTSSNKVEIRRAESVNFLNYFISGYQRENYFNPSWLEYIPNFLKLREMTVFTVINKKWDLSNLNENQKLFLERTKYNIENDIPYVDYDFTRLSETLF